MGDIAAGYTCVVYYKEEAGAYGTIADANIWQWLGPVTTLPFEIVKERAKVVGLNSRIRINKPVLKEEDSSSLEVPLQLTTNWVLLKDIDDAVLKLYSLCIRVTYGGSEYFVYGHGIRLDEAELSTVVNDLIKLKITFNTQRFTGPFASDQYTSTTYEAADVSDPQIWLDGKISKVAASGWAATGDMDEVSSWTINIKNNYEKKFGWTNAYPRLAQEKGFDVDFSFEKDFVDLEELTEILTETTGSIRFYVSAAEYVEVTGANFDDFSTDLAEIELLAQSISGTADDCAFV